MSRLLKFQFPSFIILSIGRKIGQYCVSHETKRADDVILYDFALNNTLLLVVSHHKIQSRLYCQIRFFPVESGKLHTYRELVSCIRFTQVTNVSRHLRCFRAVLKVHIFQRQCQMTAKIIQTKTNHKNFIIRILRFNLKRVFNLKLTLKKTSLHFNVPRISERKLHTLTITCNASIFLIFLGL